MEKKLGKGLTLKCSKDEEFTKNIRKDKIGYIKKWNNKKGSEARTNNIKRMRPERLVKRITEAEKYMKRKRGRSRKRSIDQIAERIRDKQKYGKLARR